MKYIGYCAELETELTIEQWGKIQDTIKKAVADFLFEELGNCQYTQSVFPEDLKDAAERIIAESEREDSDEGVL